MNSLDTIKFLMVSSIAFRPSFSCAVRWVQKNLTSSSDKGISKRISISILIDSNSTQPWKYSSGRSYLKNFKNSVGTFFLETHAEYLHSIVVVNLDEVFLPPVVLFSNTLHLIKPISWKSLLFSLICLNHSRNSKKEIVCSKRPSYNALWL